MGIRPQFYLMVGVADVDSRQRNQIVIADDLEDESKFSYFKDGDLQNDKHFHYLKVPGYEFSTLSDIIYNPFAGDEYRIGGLVGMLLLDKMAKHKYDDDILRALATLDDKFMQRGYAFLPDDQMNKWEMKQRGITEEDIRCHRAVPGVFEGMIQMSRLHWKRARFYLAQVGWDVAETDLHYILAWDWS